MKRRLLFCTQTAHVRGGLETWLDEFIPHAGRRGWDVKVALARGAHFNDPQEYRAAHPRFDTVEVDGRTGTREGRVAALRTVIRKLRPDLVVPVNNADTLEAVAIEKQSGAATRLLVMLRAQEPAGELEDVRRFRDFIDVAVGGNRLLEALLAEWSGMPPERLLYIPPGSRRNSAFERTNNEGPLRIGYVGRLAQADKRVLELADVTDTLDALAVPYRLTVAGDGPEREALAARLRGRGEILGNVELDTLYASVFPNLDVLLLFSEAEAGPQVVWQAMHYGVVPVVSRYRGATAEGILRHDDTAMLFDVGDWSSAASSIRALSVDRERLTRIASAAARAVDPEYLTDHSFEKWIEAFEMACTLPAAVGTELPGQQPSGLLERAGLSPSTARRIRKLLGRTARPSGPGAEWPHHHGISEEAASEISMLASQLDRTPIR